MTATATQIIKPIDEYVQHFAKIDLNCFSYAEHNPKAIPSPKNDNDDFLYEVRVVDSEAVGDYIQFEIVFASGTVEHILFSAELTELQAEALAATLQHCVNLHRIQHESRKSD